MAARAHAFVGALAVASAAWNPVPPCPAPAGISAPAVNETMCSNTIVPAPPENTISIRQYGLPYNETLSESGSDTLSVKRAALNHHLSIAVTYTLDSATIWPSVLSELTLSA